MTVESAEDRLQHFPVLQDTDINDDTLVVQGILPANILPYKYGMCCN
ncbi:hypothetical protein H6F32_05865 [Anabaena sp. FACHB-1237]|nr:hypothetical protein [Anabaena sp. FACHB-1237]MBD2137118.1 hypothetical protein [Anabaena sp. FACHB-1237]